MVHVEPYTSNKKYSEYMEKPPLNAQADVSKGVGGLTFNLSLHLQLNPCKTTTLKKTQNWFPRPIIAYCRSKVLQNDAILSTFAKQQFVIKIFVLSIFEWPFYTGFTVYLNFV